MNIPEGMSNAAMWAIVIGFVQPIALQFILQQHWSSRMQSLSAFGFSILTGGLTAWFTGAFTGVGVVSTVLIVLVASISTYEGFWKKTTSRLKAATSRKPESPNT